MPIMRQKKPSAAISAASMVKPSMSLPLPRDKENAFAEIASAASGQRSRGISNRNSGGERRLRLARNILRQFMDNAGRCETGRGLVTAAAELSRDGTDIKVTARAQRILKATSLDLEI